MYVCIFLFVCCIRKWNFSRVLPNRQNQFYTNDYVDIFYSIIELNHRFVYHWTVKRSHSLDALLRVLFVVCVLFYTYLLLLIKNRKCLPMANYYDHLKILPHFFFTYVCITIFVVGTVSSEVRNIIIMYLVIYIIL